MSVAARSEQGRRGSNDDVVLTTDEIIVLADGIGGHAGGRQAAMLAAAAAFAALTAPSVRTVEAALWAANSAVREYRIVNEEHSRAGCTLSIAAMVDAPVMGRQFVIGHVGDSPVFLLRGDQLELLTSPHISLRGRRVGLTRSIGDDAGPFDVDVTSVAWQPGDRLLVASDGLLDGMSVDDLRDRVARDVALDVIVRDLVHRALDVSRDNVTVALLEAADVDVRESAHG